MNEPVRSVNPLQKQILTFFFLIQKYKIKLVFSVQPDEKCDNGKFRPTDEKCDNDKQSFIQNVRYF